MVQVVEVPLDTSRIPAQRRFMESTAPELLYSGAFGAGKTRIGCEKALFLSLKYPGNFGLVLRKTYRSLRVTTMETFFRDVCPKSLIKAFNKNEGMLYLHNGSRILFSGLDDPAKVASLEVGFVFVDEAIELTEDDWMMLVGRLRLNKVPFRQIFACTNPGPPTHWLYQRAYVQKLMEVVEANALSNPFLPDDYKRRLAEFKGAYYERYVLGKWVGFEGLVYDCWNPAEHLIDPFPIPGHWERFRTVDFGYTNPFVCQWWAKAPKDDPTYKGWYLYREIYYSHKTIDEHAKDIINLSRGETIKATVADWQAGDRGVLERYGIPTIPARKDVLPGIQRVYALITQGRIHIFRNALVEVDHSLKDEGKPFCTASEFGLYRWATSRSGKEAPVDEHNHGLDALRYLVYTLDADSQPLQEVLTAPNPQPLRNFAVWGMVNERPWRQERPRWRAV